jgi:hypothetical protein
MGKRRSTSRAGSEGCVGSSLAVRAALSSLVEDASADALQSDTGLGDRRADARVAERFEFLIEAKLDH